ncbi:gliding motility-associated C-terminal domain-containing protein [Parasediminibacterium sp. JCM 36343]|uniref:T9SS type B sorting domain-containing protein n=1 Tax=Parasediminibacterium sp. JCM 36343 TaxID=3374279 RepID=UPI00397A5332
MAKKIFSTGIFFIVLFIVFSSTAKCMAQCNNAITNYPYHEDFEASDGKWVAGGINSDWAWGTPQKAIINKAASGTKCWIIGGLTGNKYNDGEKSTLQSPCFNLSLLTNPYLSFKVFWETESKYDGANFQYSIDNGANWLNLGSSADAINCPNDNWFNTTSITAIGSNSTNNSNGWSGSVSSGDGSGKWVSAKHSLDALKSQKQVIFKFSFSAGTKFNDYNGFAVDDINISEPPPNVATFTYACSPSKNKTVDFTGGNVVCPSVFNWDFGDPNSGPDNNTSSDPAPSHEYSAAGKYTVILTVTNPATQPPAVVVSPPVYIQVADATISVVKDILCYGDTTGALQVSVNPTFSDTYTYIWNNNPRLTSALIPNLPASIYSVAIRSSKTCASAAPVSLPTKRLEPLQHSAEAVNPVCETKGRITIIETGGTGNYISYTWTPNVSNSLQASNLVAGTYKVVITDDNNCTDTSTFTLVDMKNTTSVNLGNDTIICPGEKLLLDAGIFPSYKWQDLSNTQTYDVTKTGVYSVIVADKDGCTASDNIQVTVQCNDIFFPTAFTPNGDPQNPTFGPGPAASLAAISKYEFKIYNRLGQLIFTSNNPYKQWDGTVKGVISNGTYVWFANYTIANRKNLSKQGVFLLFR